MAYEMPLMGASTASVQAESLQRVIENMPKNNEVPSSFHKIEDTEHSETSSPLVLTPQGALDLLTRLQKLLTSIESRNTGRDGIDFLSCKDYEDPDYQMLEEGSCQLQCMDAMALAGSMSDNEKLVFGIHLYNIMVSVCVEDGYFLLCPFSLTTSFF